MPYVYEDPKLSPAERARDLLTHMTLEEKIGQLNQRLYGFAIYERKEEEIILTEEFKEEVKKYSGLGTLYGLYRADPWAGKDFNNGLYGALSVQAYNQVQKYVLTHSRLKIPMLLSSECPHGHQALDGYLLPVNLCSGASFHPSLLKEAYEVCGEQLKELGVDLALVSTLDILRDPRWGRSEECYSEDPYLASEFARAAVEGLQSRGVGAVAKHFCAQGEGTGGINASAARIGERELREIHFPAMEACAKAGVKGVMAAYNEIDGVFCHANSWLLTKVLREEMGFDGVVMADGVAIDQLDVMTNDRIVSGALALQSGVDIGLWDEAFSLLGEAYEKGFVKLEDIDRAVQRVLTLKFERGLFEQPYLPEHQESKCYSEKEYPQSYQLALESAVLLKNEHKILPVDISKVKSIAVIGPNADEIYHQLGDYTPPIRAEEGITVLRGIKDYIRDSGQPIEVKFSKGCGLLEGSEAERLSAVALAKECDLVIAVLGGSSSRFGDVTFDSNGAAIVGKKVSMDCGEGVDSATLSLPETQLELIMSLAGTGCNLITVVLQGRPYVLTQVEECSKGLLCSFYNGPWGGRAIAELLFGKYSPSGRLPVSLPRHVGQLPVYYNYRSSYAAMNYYDIAKSPLHPFGSGLCYTTFAYRDFYLQSN
ncbi:MAG: beta-glucosidase, partial [Herbinix sp.]|nr:beta-glucosidase [Herbinix sp.]